MNSVPAVNHWHKSLLVTGQLGSAEALLELGGDVHISSAEILAAQRGLGVLRPSVLLQRH